MFQSLHAVAAALQPNPTKAGERLKIPKSSLSKFLNADTLLKDEHLQTLARELNTSSETLEELFRNEKGTRQSNRTATLNETAGIQSNEIAQRMFEQERKEFVAALQWMVERHASETDLEKLHKEVWSAKLSAAAKHAIMAAVLSEQEKRLQKAQSQN